MSLVIIYFCFAGDYPDENGKFSNIQDIKDKPGNEL